MAREKRNRTSLENIPIDYLNSFSISRIRPSVSLA